MSKNQATYPVLGACVVLHSDQQKSNHGRVIQFDQTNTESVLIRWIKNNATEWVSVNRLRCGFKPGMDVLVMPIGTQSGPVIEGKVLKTRLVANSEQVLIDFSDIDDITWMPWYRLTWVKGTEHLYLGGEQDGSNVSERLRLRTLAWALKLWNENTGSLARFDIDPLPHQIHLVHHILASGDLNWLIADDVGLGKTIETGLFLAALKQSKQVKRILLITPAGLTRQWQEELNNKFNMGNFTIYGDDFSIREPRHWKLHDCVIASIDRLKMDEHIENITKADPWDLIIFDEAHKLTRRQYGNTYNTSQRFILAAKLRTLTNSILMLTATPHQGKQDSFIALLELLHPERKTEIQMLEKNPEILQDMVFRNNKADVTDIDGNFIFQGKTTKALEVSVSHEAHQFDKDLQQYLHQGYNAGQKQGKLGNAIGFVMTVYRKLAASSITAILDALERRMIRLKNTQKVSAVDNIDLDMLMDSHDMRFEGEFEELQIDYTYMNEFFEGEIIMLESLIAMAKTLQFNDRKLELFLDKVVDVVLNQNPTEKILVFSEYRGTQDWIKKALDNRYGVGKTVVINGSMNIDDRRQAIANFQHDAQFLLSTEAGGEGINLQKNCFIMVNYDLPWNPMRIVQRIGRLYRYGQSKNVVVFNIHSPDTLDEKVIDILYKRLDQVISDMLPVGDDYTEAMKDDILGEMSDLIDVKDILLEARDNSIQRTTDRIDEALKRAKDAVTKQKMIFEHTAGFDPNEMQGSLIINSSHLVSFVNGMFSQLNVDIIKTTYNKQIWHIKLPQDVMNNLGLRQSKLTICFNRSLAIGHDRYHMMDSDSWLLDYLFEVATSHDFQGKTATYSGIESSSTFLSAILKWQNESGNRIRREFAIVEVDNSGNTVMNSNDISNWLLSEQCSLSSYATQGKNQHKEYFNAINQIMSDRLDQLSTSRLLPDSVQWISGGWKV